MKEIPMLFSNEMVQALLAGRKTMTRRVIKQAIGWDAVWKPTKIKEEHLDGIPRYEMRVGTQYSLPWFKCPYGQVGDILWVRESVSYFRQADGRIQREKTKYKADEKWNGNKLIKWKPSIHMPKEACRLKLKITNIRVERLTDITEKDAIAEGVEQKFSHLFNEWRFKDYANVKDDWRSAVSSFQSLWASINGIDAWDEDPWVWVIEFERVVA